MQQAEINHAAYVRYVKDHIRGDIEDSLYSFIHQNCLDMASVGGSFKNLREKIYRAAFLYAFFRTTDEVVSSFSAEMISANPLKYLSEQARFYHVLLLPESSLSSYLPIYYFCDFPNNTSFFNILSFNIRSIYIGINFFPCSESSYLMIWQSIYRLFGPSQVPALLVEIEGLGGCMKRNTHRFIKPRKPANAAVSGGWRWCTIRGSNPGHPD